MLVLLIVCHFVCIRHSVTYMTRSFERWGGQHRRYENRRLSDLRAAVDCLLAAVNHRPLHEPRGSHGSFPHRHSHSSLRPTVVCPPSQMPTGLNGHTTPGGAVNLDRASADPEYEVAIYQVIESRVVCWSRLPSRAGGYTNQQLQGLGLETHVLHSLAHSIRAGRVNP